MPRGDSLAWSGDARRREERRAAARLSEGLKRLDEAEHYQLNTLSREQRQLRRDLSTLGNPWRRGVHNLGVRLCDHDLSHTSIPGTKTTLPIIPAVDQDRWRQRSVVLLQTRVQDFISSSTAPFCLPDLKPQPACTLSCMGTNGKEMEREKEKEGQRIERATDRDKDEQVEKDRRMKKEREMHEGLHQSSSPCKEGPGVGGMLSEALADGGPRTLHTLPDLPQALAEAGKARYIRRRGQAACERELSIAEIFSWHVNNKQRKQQEK